MVNFLVKKHRFTLKMIVFGKNVPLHRLYSDTEAKAETEGGRCIEYTLI